MICYLLRGRSLRKTCVVFQLETKRKKTNMKLLIVTACLLAYAVTQPVSQLGDSKEIAETANKITESFDETLPPQNG